MQTITFTPLELYTSIMGLCGAIVTLSAAGVSIAKVVGKIKAPEDLQNARLSRCEERLNDHDKLFADHRLFFANDNKRIKDIEESNRVTQRAMLALLKHSINGDDLESLKRAERDLENFLISKTQEKLC